MLERSIPELKRLTDSASLIARDYGQTPMFHALSRPYTLQMELFGKMAWPLSRLRPLTQGLALLLKAKLPAYMLNFVAPGGSGDGAAISSERPHRIDRK